MGDIFSDVLGVDDDKMNRHMQSVLANNKKSSDASGTDVKDNPHNKPPSGTKSENNGPMKGTLMTWTELLESITNVAESIPNAIANDDMGDTVLVDTNEEMDDVEGEPGPTAGGSDKDLLEELNQIFTPILVMQSIEGDMSDQINEAFSEASVLMEHNMIHFDDESRMAQLVSVCALLIERQRNSEKWQIYQNAAITRNKMKLEIQKQNYDEAMTLAQKFLVKVSTTNTSSIARNAANDLLPQTQH